VTRNRRAPIAVVSALLLGPAASLSCGPSVQSIYEGDVRFEHCYRLDLELDIATSHRQACWTNWLNRYTYGQTRDRLEYARRRVRSFASGDTARPELNVGADTAEQRESRQFYLVVPAPTSVHAPPPPIATRVNLSEPAPIASSARSTSATPSDSAAPSNSATAAASAAPAPSAAPPPSHSSAPGEECAAACRSAFSNCSHACAGDAKGTACKSCDPDYKKCMQRCFE
jgi:hypothetical protein